MLVIGLLMLIWIAVWMLVIKHYALALTLPIVGLTAIPLLILLRFWWSLEELKDLPTIADQMMGDAKQNQGVCPRYS